MSQFLAMRRSPNGGNSNSNSGGEEDDRDAVAAAAASALDAASGKRSLGAILNGLSASAKKRRKQSKPIRLGADAPEAEGRREFVNDEPDEGPEPGERSDGPLNLSGSSSKDEESGVRPPALRVLGPELMAAAVAGGEEAGLLRTLGEGGLPGGNPMIPTSLYQGMLGPFGIPPFPFQMPSGLPTSLAGGIRPPTSTAGGISGANGGRIQIFNPEAYCELCNKEFCNKYFLKTHKANKHGIYSEGAAPPGDKNNGAPNGNGNAAAVPTSSAGPMSSTQTPPNGQQQNPPPPLPPPPPPPPSSSHQGEPGQLHQGGPPTPTSQAGSPFSGAFIAANMGALRPPFLPLSPGASPSPSSSSTSQNQSNNNTNNVNNGGTPPQSKDAPPSRDGSDHSPRALPPRAGSPMGDPIPGAEELRKSLESPRAAGSLPPPPSLPGLPPNLPNFNPMMFGGLPSLDAMRKEHDGELRKDPLSGRPIPNIPNIPNVPMLSMKNRGPSLGGSPGTPPGAPGPPRPNGPFTPEKLRQMGVINADAFCEICCKEFCNKYFLRVHKLKKHGICSPDLPPEKVQKILTQMAKEAGKTGNPPPPIIRPGLLDPNRSPSGPFGGPPGLAGLGPGLGPPLRPPTSLAGMNLPHLEPLQPHALKDFTAPLPTSISSALSSPLRMNGGDPKANERSSELQEREIIRINDDSSDGQNSRDDGVEEGERQPGNQQPSEDLQRLQSMIMELNSNKAAAAAAAAAAAGNAQQPPPPPPPPPRPASQPPQQASQAPPPPSVGSPVESSFCKVCNKDMENKYFLRAHMMNEHGMLHLEEPPQMPIEPAAKPPPPPASEGGADPAAVAAAAAAAAVVSEKGSPFGLLNGENGPMAADFATKFLQQMQKGLGLNKPLEVDELNFLEKFKAELAAGAAAGAGLQPKKQPERDPNKKPASLSRSYCEICKKELCNKYFMKTHMMKMHGINIETTIAPGGASGGVTCTLCKKELSSKYFLKVHLQGSVHLPNINAVSEGHNNHKNDSQVSTSILRFE